MVTLSVLVAAAATAQSAQAWVVERRNNTKAPLDSLGSVAVVGEPHITILTRIQFAKESRSVSSAGLNGIWLESLSIRPDLKKFAGKKVLTGAGEEEWGVFTPKLGDQSAVWSTFNPPPGMVFLGLVYEGNTLLLISTDKLGNWRVDRQVGDQFSLVYSTDNDDTSAFRTLPSLANGPAAFRLASTLGEINSNMGGESPKTWWQTFGAMGGTQFGSFDSGSGLVAVQLKSRQNGQFVIARAFHDRAVPSLTVKATGIQMIRVIGTTTYVVRDAKFVDAYDLQGKLIGTYPGIDVLP